MHGRHRAREAFRQAESLPRPTRWSELSTGCDGTGPTAAQPVSEGRSSKRVCVGMPCEKRQTCAPAAALELTGVRSAQCQRLLPISRQCCCATMVRCRRPSLQARGCRTPASVRRNGCCALLLPSHREHWNANPQQWNTPDRTEDAAEAHASACNRRHPDWSNQERRNDRRSRIGSNTVIVLRRSVWPRRTPLAQQRTWP